MEKRKKKGYISKTMKRVQNTSMKAFAASICLFFVVGFPGAWALGKRESDGAEKVRAMVFHKNESRLLSAYIVDGGDSPAEKLYVEGTYVPQAAAAYFPTGFAISQKGKRLDFNAELSYRILSKSDLGDGVVVYTLEASGSGADSKDGKRYNVSFSRSALGNGGAAVQPAPYALERAARMSGLEIGKARLESLRYDTASGLFKAMVVVSS